MFLKIFIAFLIVMASYGYDAAVYSIAGLSFVMSIIFYYVVFRLSTKVDKIEYIVHMDLMDFLTVSILNGGMVYSLYVNGFVFLAGWILPWIVISFFIGIVAVLIHYELISIEFIDKDEE